MDGWMNEVDDIYESCENEANALIFADSEVDQHGGAVGSGEPAPSLDRRKQKYQSCDSHEAKVEATYHAFG